MGAHCVFISSLGKNGVIAASGAMISFPVQGSYKDSARVVRVPEPFRTSPDPNPWT